MTRRKPKVLIIEDEIKTRVTLKILIEQTLECEVDAATSFSDLKNKLMYQYFDGVIADLDLSSWNNDNPKDKKIGKQSVDDGLKVIKLLQDNKDNCTICVLSAYLEKYNSQLESIKDEYKISKPLPLRLADFNKAFKFFQREIMINCDNNLKLFTNVNTYNKLYIVEKKSYYRNLLQHRNRDVFFNELGDLSWEVECNSNILRDNHGVSLDLDIHKVSDVGLIYLNADVTNMYIEKEKHFPIPFWNLRKIEFIEKQFDLLNLFSGIPKEWRVYFNLSVANKLAESYMKNKELYLEKDRKLLSQLPFDAKLEFQRNIIEKYSQDKKDGDFIENELDKINQIQDIKIVEYFVGRVDSVENETAWVELTSLINPEKSFTKPLKYEVLKSNGIKEEEEEFSYTVSERDEYSIGKFEPIK